ncbi:undecaprenyl-diphosphatase [Acinetobacter sp. SWAC5]|uniref:undecaprenyl-diphosphatase n=1 Tax=Acinetobacter sp. SWAC5 TaxID=2293835 RepID=UPI000E34ED7A|nr:undecaprenyl-diphosphatase [Acinetobacter sp. SWAC5]RFS31376.1 undecaprenyl-diphosphatase [Acinetobacter sp. SWAC5]
MSIEHLNLWLYQILNVPDQASNGMMNYAIFVAHDLIYLMLFIFIFCWLRGSFETKKSILKAFIFTAITLVLGETLSLVFNTPRPFVMDVGQTLIEHSPTGSFPSNHMSIFSGIAFSYYFSERRDIGRFLIAVAWLVAWSRVYVGVHFPIDMLGGFFIAWLVNYSGLKVWNKYKDQIMMWVMNIYQKLFRPLIEKGLIK